MGRHLPLLVLASLAVAGCYMSHELGDDAGRPTDASRPDIGHLDLGPVMHADLGTGICLPGTTEPVPCGHCGTAIRSCLGDGTWRVSPDCMGETPTCGLDVMLLADVTGSHTGVFQSSADALQSELIEPLEGDADVRVGVSAFADYPFGGYGTSTDVPFVGVLEPTHDVAAVNDAIRHIMFLGGDDQPEAEIEGLNDLAGGTPHPTAVPFHCTSGGVGGGCWRPMAAWRVIVVMTDTASHGLPSPGGHIVQPYGTDLIPPAPAWPDVQGLLTSTATYVYWIVPDDPGGPGTDNVSASEQAGELARELGEDPMEAVCVYTAGNTTPAISLLRERVIVHFGLHVP